jgi:hypothetical protein
MKADGTVMKLWSTVSVKEILIDYPNHGIFEAAAFGGLGICRLPLPERAALVAGHLYYLIPLPFSHQEFINYNNNTNRGHFARASSRLQPPSSAGTATDSIKQEKADDHVVNKINRGGVRLVSSSYSTHRSTVRVKFRLRKADLASFLSAKKVNIVMENVVVAPSIQDATRQSQWKPRLDTIAETPALLEIFKHLSENYGRI